MQSKYETAHGVIISEISLTPAQIQATEAFMQATQEMSKAEKVLQDILPDNVYAQAFGKGDFVLVKEAKEHKED